jgi:poly(3-hydroxybutyrate) depolymerase
MSTGNGPPTLRARLVLLLLLPGLFWAAALAFDRALSGERSSAAPATEAAPRAAAPQPSPSASPAPVAALEKPRFGRINGVTTARAYPRFNETFRLWRQKVPGIRDVRIPSTRDDHRQPALWLPEQRDGRPLLVVLHSWSVSYKQRLGVPFALWADRHGWSMIAPNFRGANDNARATGSDLAVQDVADAIGWARARAAIDEGRVFVIGFSGGGMMSLLMAGRHPELFAGAVAWVPVHDLVQWYGYTSRKRPQPHYPEHIRASCGGDPSTNARARSGCAYRSPRAHLSRARAAAVPVYIGHGLGDQDVRPDHAVQAFNQLAAPDDRVPRAAIAAIRRNVLPPVLRRSVEAPTYFGTNDPRVLFARKSGEATVVLFEGGHDMVYHPGLRWMWELAHADRGRAADKRAPRPARARPSSPASRSSRSRSRSGSRPRPA